MVAILRAAWRRWSAFAHVLGNIQARVLLSLFYFTVAAPFVFIVKVFYDPLTLRASSGDTGWVTRPTVSPTADTARAQF